MMKIPNYATHDEELRTAVLHEIEWRPDIHSQDINVKVSGSAVALTGFVNTLAEKTSAEKAAKSVHGVISIANDIAGRRSTRTDPESWTKTLAFRTLDCKRDDGGFDLPRSRYSSTCRRHRSIRMAR